MAEVGCQQLWNARPHNFQLPSRLLKQHEQPPSPSHAHHRILAALAFPLERKYTVRRLRRRLHHPLAHPPGHHLPSTPRAPSRVVVRFLAMTVSVAAGICGAQAVLLRSGRRDLGFWLGTKTIPGDASDPLGDSGALGLWWVGYENPEAIPLACCRP